MDYVGDRDLLGVGQPASRRGDSPTTCGQNRDSIDGLPRSGPDSGHRLGSTHADPRPLRPGTLSPWREVPAAIVRPEYVGKAGPKKHRGSDVQTPEIIEKMRIAGRLAAQATQLAGEHCQPGVTTDEIDAVVHEFLCDHGAYPSTLGYKGFPKSCCTSLNEVICHGIPDTTVIEDGDIINVDVTAYIDGVHGDTDATFCVGNVSEEAGCSSSAPTRR
jgi:methionyl aminopeptidase